MHEINLDSPSHDAEYEDRVKDGVMAAIVEGARDPETGIASLRNGEITKALIYCVATVVEASAACRTPQGQRLASEAIGKHLLGCIRTIRTERLVAQRKGAAT